MRELRRISSFATTSVTSRRFQAETEKTGYFTHFTLTTDLLRKNEVVTLQWPVPPVLLCLGVNPDHSCRTFCVSFDLHTLVFLLLPLQSSLSYRGTWVLTYLLCLYSQLCANAFYYFPERFVLPARLCLFRVHQNITFGICLDRTFGQSCHCEVVRLRKMGWYGQWVDMNRSVRLNRFNVWETWIYSGGSGDDQIAEKSYLAEQLTRSALFHPQKSWADKADNPQNYGFHQINSQQENALNCR